jgi:hypothetical protein
MAEPVLKLGRWNGTAIDIGELWTLLKGKRAASCHFWTHPKGGEARLTVDGEWHRGSTAVDGLTLLDVSLEWQKQFEAKGWSSAR